MAIESDVARALGDQLRAKGFVCGQRFQSTGDAVRSIKAQFPDETEESLRRKVDTIIAAPAYRFKSKNNGSEVSASDPPKCGS